MKEVLRYIFDKKRTYQRLPLFEWMRDESLPPRARLAFYPCMAPFILSFGDLNKFVLRGERPKDRFQWMVNAHTLEDDHHWPWYLEDFIKLGFDTEMRGSDWMKFLWGEETQHGRILMTRLTTLISGTAGIDRLVIIEAIEETGNILFAAMLPLALAVEQQTGQDLRYCGHFHFDLESGHAVGADHKALAIHSLTESERDRSRAMADEVFSAFEAWTHELLRYALAHPMPAHRSEHGISNGSSGGMRIGDALKSG